MKIDLTKIEGGQGITFQGKVETVNVTQIQNAQQISSPSNLTHHPYIHEIQIPLPHHNCSELGTWRHTGIMKYERMQNLTILYIIPRINIYA